MRPSLTPDKKIQAPRFSTVAPISKKDINKNNPPKTPTGSKTPTRC